MTRLTLLTGPAGCGKTHRVLDAVAQAAAAMPLPGAGAPPLLVIVPEQQAAGTERALLERLGELNGQAPVSARIQVMSLTRLARVLAERAGVRFNPIGGLARRLLVWRLLADDTDPARRRARADALSDLLAELALYGVRAEDLSRRAAELRAAEETGPVLDAGGDLPGKLDELGRLLAASQAECTSRGLSLSPAAALVPRLLTAAHWPALAQTRVWIDGFAGFTPADELALSALLERCADVTATVLLDPARRDGPAATDSVDWYAPTRQTWQRWLSLAKDAGAVVQAVPVSGPGRWPADSPLAGPANHRRVAMADAGAAQAYAQAAVYSTEREEVDAAARWILDLATAGMRFGEISVVTRSLEPYADLVSARFAEHGIPCHLDRRLSVASHPLTELLRCTLRLLLGQAGEEDIYTLLKTGLSSGPAEGEDVPPPVWRDRADQLENYARAHGLRPHHWLRDKPWDWRSRFRRYTEDKEQRAQQMAREAERVARLDDWRRALLGPVMAARASLDADPAPTVADTLAALWRVAVTPAVQAGLESWAVRAEQANPPRREEAAIHRKLPVLASQLLDELVRLAGDLLLGTGGMDHAELCAWLEYGLADLSIGQPPLQLDSVLVTEIERGRHHPVRATVLLGLADGSWPPAAAETAYLSDAQRARINGAPSGERGRGLVAAGAVERAGREPYLALVALTRASEYLCLSRPGADENGAQRPQSPYYTLALELLGIKEALPAPNAAGCIGTPADFAIWAAQSGGSPLVRDVLARAAPAMLPALDWAAAYSGSSAGLDNLPAGVVRDVFGMDGPGPLHLRCSPSRLESFAACPAQHFARYLLRLSEREEAAFDTRTLGSFYHQLLQVTIDRLNAAGHIWPGQPSDVYSAALDVLGETTAELTAGSGRERAAHVLERARVLLWHHAVQLCRVLQQYERSPQATELHIGGRAGTDLPPLKLSGEGWRLELHGFIDRLDRSQSGRATIVDYKLGGSQVNWARFLAGQQLQLFAYLLASTGMPGEAGGEDAAPEAVEYQPIEARWKQNCGDFEPQRIPPEMSKPSDREKLADLLPGALRETRRIISELADRLTAGEIAPRPLSWKQMGGGTACGFCSYRAVCRFDPQTGERYREADRRGNAALRDAIAADDDFSGSAGTAATEVQP